MRFLLLNQFYPPDVAPTGQYLHCLAQVLVERGHQVKVMCSRGGYTGGSLFPGRQILDGVEVMRVVSLGSSGLGLGASLAGYLSFYLFLAMALLRETRRPDLILSLTTPPYIGLMGKLAARKFKCAHAHWIMDLYPDVMMTHGMTRDGGAWFRLLQKLTRIQLQGAQQIIALGPIMAERVAAYAEKSVGRRAEVFEHRFPCIFPCTENIPKSRNGASKKQKWQR